MKNVPATNQLTSEQVADKTNQFVTALPSEIKDYIINDDGPCGCILAHPFYQIVGIEHYIAAGLLTQESIVEEIATRRARYDKDCADGNFDEALSQVGKAYRVDHLLELVNIHGVELAYVLIGEVWISVEGMQHRFEEWNEIWSHVIDGDGDRLQVMGAEDRKIYDALPDMLTVFRGHQNDGGEYGWSWSVDRTKAEWFARRGIGAAKVAIVTIPKRVTLAYFGGRNEAEIVIHPDQFGDEIVIEELSRDDRVAA